MAKRESRAHRRRRVMRNRIILALVLLVIIVVVVLVLIVFGKKKKNPVNPSTDNTETTAEDTTTEDLGYEDSQAPQVTAPTYIYISLGDSVAYKSYIVVNDDHDDYPTIEVDNSDVDLSAEGDYVVHYKVTDAAGNATEVDVPVIVGPAEEAHVDEDVIYELADQVLAEIIDDEMTDLEKVFAVFFYARDSFEYVPNESKWEYKQEAYKMMTTGYDNCYGNVCVSKLLLERLGFESISVEGGDMDYMDEHHYWNMVSIDGGETWYQYDSAIWVWRRREIPICMVTDKVFMEISDRHDGLYNFDKSKYPATPTEDLWTEDDLESMGIYIEEAAEPEE